MVCALLRAAAPHTAAEQLIGHGPEEDHRAHDGEIERPGDVEQVHQIPQHLQQRRPDDDAEHGAFPAAQTAAAPVPTPE